MNCSTNIKGHPPSADLRYGEEDSISPSPLIFAAIKSKLRINTLHINPDVPKKTLTRKRINSKFVTKGGNRKSINLLFFHVC